MTKAVAKLGIIVALGFLSLGNFWFTYGVWPRSWWSFALFLLATIVVMGLDRAIEAEAE